MILIALIVLIFSGHGAKDLTREVHELRSEVGELKKSVEEQTAEIKSLRQKLEKQQALEK